MGVGNLAAYLELLVARTGQSCRLDRGVSLTELIPE
jgi:hypothetical protein